METCYCLGKAKRRKEKIKNIKENNNKHINAFVNVVDDVVGSYNGNSIKVWCGTNI